MKAKPEKRTSWAGHGMHQGYHKKTSFDTICPLPQALPPAKRSSRRAAPLLKPLRGVPQTKCSFFPPPVLNNLIRTKKFNSLLPAESDSCHRDSMSELPKLPSFRFFLINAPPEGMLIPGIKICLMTSNGCVYDRPTGCQSINRRHLPDTDPRRWPGFTDWNKIYSLSGRRR